MTPRIRPSRAAACGDPALGERVAAGLELALGIDARNPGPTNRSGVRIGAMAAPAVDVTRGFDRSWIRYSGLVEGSWDVTGKGRVLSLGLVTMFADRFALGVTYGL